MKMKSFFIIILAGILSLAGSELIDAKKKNRCDLIVKSLSAPSSADIGSIIRIVSRVKNKGKKKAKSSYITFYLSADGSYDPSEDEYLGRIKVSSLKKKRTSKKYKKTVTIPSYVLAGTYYIIAMADGKEKIKENSEKNNYRKRSITIKNPYVGEFAAEGIYTYNSGDGALNLNITTSEFKDCGPEVGTLALTVSSLTATTMIWGDPGDDDSTNWTRDSGSEGDIVGEWSMSEEGNLYTLTLNADGTLTVLGKIVNCGPQPPLTFTIPTASINIDGNINDWSSINPVFVDDVNDQHPEADFDGTDLHEFYLAKDNDFLYVMLTLHDGNPKTDIPTRYAFEPNQNQDGPGVAGNSIATVYFFEGKWHATAGIRDQSQVTYPSNYVGIGSNFIEWKVSLSDMHYIDGRYLGIHIVSGGLTGIGGGPIYPASDGASPNIILKLNE